MGEMRRFPGILHKVFRNKDLFVKYYGIRSYPCLFSASGSDSDPTSAPHGRAPVPPPLSLFFSKNRSSWALCALLLLWLGCSTAKSRSLCEKDICTFLYVYKAARTEHFLESYGPKLREPRSSRKKREAPPQRRSEVAGLRSRREVHEWRSWLEKGPVWLDVARRPISRGNVVRRFPFTCRKNSCYNFRSFCYPPRF